ncbi:hypothetical protein SCUCBS95973_008954 [Sporothrix curviconia]|uniref:DUF7924 domain-containing protein n=1 Tax=Sporothrix curviconia TaxID=1260050 RepID=A0ABP0CR50_9PEZI
MGDSTPWDKGRTPGAGAEQSRPVVQEDQTVLAAPSVLDLADKHPKPLDETVSGWPGISVPSDKCSAFNAAVFPSVEINETVQEDETHDQRESVDPFEDDEQPDEELRQYSDPENEDDMATGTRDSGYRDFTNSGKSGMAYPFLVGEFKSSVTLGNLYVAVNQLAGAVAACLNAVHQLNATLAEIGKKKNSGGGTPPCMVENIAYGMAIDADQAKIYIGWMELKNGVPYYYLRQVERYTNTEPGDFVVFCQRVRNILDWAKTTRRESICNALDIVRRANCGPGPPVAWAATVRSGPSAGADPQTGDKRARALDDTGSNGNSKRRDNNSGKGQFNQDL